MSTKNIQLICPNCNSTNVETRESWKRTVPPKRESAHRLMLPRRVTYGYKYYAHFCNECSNNWEGNKIN